MSRGKELIKNTGILFAAKMSTQLVSFFLLPMYTALLTTEQYGQLDFYSSLVMIIFPIVTLQIEQAIFRFLVGESDHEARSQVISSAVVSLTFSTVVVTIIYAIIAIVLRLEYSIALYFYYLAMMCSAILYQVCRGFGQNTTYGFASFLISSITIMLNIYFVSVLKTGVLGVVVSTTMAHMIGSFYMLLKTRIYSYIHKDTISFSCVKKMLLYSIPLIFNQISSWVINYSDRVIILSFLGIGINGIYSVANKFSNILLAFFNVFNLAWTENVVKNIGNTDVSKYANRIISFTANVYFTIITGIINLLPFVFSFFINEKFFDAYNHIPVLLAAAAFSGIAASLGSVYVAYKKTKNVGITTSLAGITNIVVHIGLIKIIGLYAASISTLVSFVALCIYRYFNIQSFFSIKLDLSVCAPVVGIFIYSWVAYILKNPVLILIGLALNLMQIGVLIIKNRKELLLLIKR